MKIKHSRNDTIFQIIVIAVVGILTLIFLYPMLYVLSMSVSATMAVVARKVYLWPVGFNLDAYGQVLKDPLVWTAYYDLGHTI